MMRVRGKNIFDVFAGILFLLFFGVIAVWIVSHKPEPNWIVQGATVGSNQYAIRLLPGYVEFWCVGPVPVLASPVYDSGMYGMNQTRLLGLSIFTANLPDSGPEAHKYHWLMVGVPIWLLLILTLSPLVLWIIFRRRNRYRGAGFPVTASPEGAGRGKEDGNI